MSKSERKHQDLATPREAPYEEIAQRAFEIYCASGYEDGCSDKHWFQAEQELANGGGSRSQAKENRKGQ